MGQFISRASISKHVTGDTSPACHNKVVVNGHMKNEPNGIGPKKPGPFQSGLQMCNKETVVDFVADGSRSGKEVAMGFADDGPNATEFGKVVDAPYGFLTNMSSQGKKLGLGPNYIGQQDKRKASLIPQAREGATGGKHVTGNSSQNYQSRAVEIQTAKSGNGKGNFGNSWANKVRASSAKSRFRLDSGFTHEHGLAEYSLPDELIMENFKDWTRCLVGFIPGSSFHFHAARTIALREWKNYDIESVASYEGFFLFRFQNEEKLHEVLADGPWLFGGKFMMLQQWHSCFVFDKNRINKVPVWIKLKGLPFTLWSHKALSFVASIVGKPLSCDRATYERSRLSYARMCIEVDANKPYVHNFTLKSKLSSDPIWICVEYEWKPQRCSKCCVYGHSCETGNAAEGKANGEQKQMDARQENKEASILAETLGSVMKGMESISEGAAVKKTGSENGVSEAGEPLVKQRAIGETSSQCATGVSPQEPSGNTDYDRDLLGKPEQHQCNSMDLVPTNMGDLDATRVVGTGAETLEGPYTFLPKEPNLVDSQMLASKPICYDAANPKDNKEIADLEIPKEAQADDITNDCRIIEKGSL